MTYIPRRDHRFEYIWEAMAFIEEGQCHSCKFKKGDNEEYPMCYDIEADFMLEQPVEDIDDRDDGGVVCIKYEHNGPVEKENHV